MVTNLAVKNCDFTNDFKPAIGKYWFHTPNTRLMITTIINQQQQMCINIPKSVYIPLDNKCVLSINDHGVSWISFNASCLYYDFKNKNC